MIVQATLKENLIISLDFYSFVSRDKNISIKIRKELFCYGLYTKHRRPRNATAYGSATL
nr:MAG TPA: hypothetical protein [Caudoviricetes sp.]